MTATSTATGTTMRHTLTTPTDRTIRVERVFDATRDRVWRAYTEPELIAQWWGRGHKVVIEKMEVERGGHWRLVEHAPDGETHGFVDTNRSPGKLLREEFAGQGFIAEKI